MTIAQIEAQLYNLNMDKARIEQAIKDLETDLMELEAQQLAEYEMYVDSLYDERDDIPDYGDYPDQFQPDYDDISAT